MLELLITNVVKPLAGRLGTMAATALIGVGVHGPLAQQVAVGVTAAALILADLALSWIGRREVAKKAEDRVWDEAMRIARWGQD